MKNTTEKSIANKYIKQKKEYQILLAEQKSRFSKVSYIRILVFCVSLISAIVLFHDDYIYSGYFVVITGMIFFIFLIIMHSRINEKIKLYEQIIKINYISLDRINDNWEGFVDKGENFINNQHSFSYDLDIFGKNSLFQHISCCNTYLGRDCLKNLLLSPNKNINEIKERQLAIKELANDLNWRQVFQASGIPDNNVTHKSPANLISWSEDTVSVIENKKIEYIIKYFPLITFVFIFWSYYSSTIIKIITLILYLAQLLLTRYRKSQVDSALIMAVKYKDQLTIYKKLIMHVEAKNFTSEYLNHIKNGLNYNETTKASKIIDNLERIVGFINLRKSSIYPLFDILFLYSWQCMFFLEKWRKITQTCLKKWLQAIGELESLSSLSIFAFDHPEWCFPEFTNDKYLFNANNLGHPLLSSRICVQNDFLFSGEGKTIMITGSNMSGKSTMLRTIGINLVLAYSGAPVCAVIMRCSIMDIYTSMRVVDNLKSNVSSFYAELLRIKMILEAIKAGKNVLFLLDEIFKGTNSRDRKMGAVAVIKNFTTERMTGIVSTHDLELTDLEKDKNFNVMNYYFRETYENDQILFDYKMRNGVSNTSDVPYLLAKIGLEF